MVGRGGKTNNILIIEIICSVSNYFPPDSAKHVYLKLHMKNKYIYNMTPWNYLTLSSQHHFKERVSISMFYI